MTNLIKTSSSSSTSLATSEYVVTKGGDAYVSQRECARLCGVMQNSIVHYFRGKGDISQGVNHENLQTVVQHYAEKGKPDAIKTLILFAKAGAKAFIYHQAGYTLEASPNLSYQEFQAPTTMLEALEYAVKLEKEKIVLLQKIEVDAPKVQFAEDVEQSDDSFLVMDVAKVFGLKPRGFFDLLRQEGFLDKKNIPYQRYIIQGLFIVKETPYQTASGTKINITPMITGKGQLYFHKKFINSTG